MSSGITTIISQITIPEKIAGVQERAADNKQVVMTTYSQEQAEERTKIVQQTEKTEKIRETRREKEKEQEHKKKKRSQYGNSGKNLDLEA